MVVLETIKLEPNERPHPQESYIETGKTSSLPLSPSPNTPLTPLPLPYPPPLVSLTPRLASI